MKKRIISAVMLICILLTSTAFAEVTPTINTSVGREVCLDVPQGKFTENGVFMVPVRRICDIFNARCDWYGDERKIILNTPDNITRVFLYIDREEFRIFTFTGVISGEGVNLPLEAPLEIVNDRTLVPFEQICKALKGEVTWSDDRTSVTVTAPEKELETKAEIYIKADKEDVMAGEEVVLTLLAKNANVLESYNFSGYSMAVVYDREKFEYVSSSLTSPDGNKVEAVKLENKNYSQDSSKAVLLATAPFAITNDETIIGKITFKALTDDGGEISLSNRVYTAGDDTALVYTKADSEDMVSVNRGTMLTIGEPVILK